MRILHLAKFYPPDFGGIESVTQALAEDHAAAGHQVEVVCFSTGDIASERPAVRLVIHRSRIWRRIASQPLSLGYLWRAIAAGRRAEIVHLHGPNPLAALAFITMAPGPRGVVHWHADIADKGFLGLLARPLEYLMLRRAAAVVCTSQAYLDASPALRRFRDKCHVIPLGIADTDPQTPSRKREATGRFVLFVGRLVGYKGLEALVKAAAASSAPVEWRIVGTGPEEERIRSLAREIGVTDKLRFLGRLEPDALERQFEEASVFVLPSANRLEAFGVVLLEAMRAGCPTVVTDIAGSGVGWVAQEGVKVPVGDHPALAEAVDDLLIDEQVRHRIGTAGRARYLAEFTRPAMSARFSALYETLRPRS